MVRFVQRFVSDEGVELVVVPLSTQHSEHHKRDSTVLCHLCPLAECAPTRSHAPCQDVLSSSWYLHEDHLHINIHKRKVNWPFILSFFAAFAAIQLLFLENARGDVDNRTEQLIWIASSLIGTIVIAFNFVRITLFSLKPWQRIPMFYGRYLQDKSDN